MKQPQLKTKTMKTLSLVFVLIGLCTFECKAYSYNYKHQKDFEPSNMFGVVFSKPFYIKGSKLGLNYNRYMIDRDYGSYTCKGYSYGFTFSHHFNGNDINKHNSQSIEFNYTPYNLNIWTYSPKITTIGFAVQIRHYDFETITISPQIKLLPPMANIYFQYNATLYNNNKMLVTPYEVGIELNTNLPTMILAWELGDLSKGFF